MHQLPVVWWDNGKIDRTIAPERGIWALVAYGLLFAIAVIFLRNWYGKVEPSDILAEKYLPPSQEILVARVEIAHEAEKIANRALGAINQHEYSFARLIHDQRTLNDLTNAGNDDVHTALGEIYKAFSSQWVNLEQRKIVALGARKDIAENIAWHSFSREVNMAKEKPWRTNRAKMRSTSNALTDWLGIGLDLLPIYLLGLVLAPIFFAVQFWEREKRFSQALTCDPTGTLIWTVFWPIGLKAFAVEFDLRDRYHHFRKVYLQSKSKDYRLTEEDEDALWLQAQEPILSFEKAQEKLLHFPGLAVRRSRWAVAVSCFCCFCHFVLPKGATRKSFPKAIAQTDEAPQAKVGVTNGSDSEKIGGDTASSSGILPTLITTVLVAIPITFGFVPSREFLLREARPRGPPMAGRKSELSSSLASMRRGG